MTLTAILALGACVEPTTAPPSLGEQLRDVVEDRDPGTGTADDGGR